MTSQQAIRLIRNLPTMCEFTDAYGEPIDSDAYYEAVDMAIFALQAQELSEAHTCVGCKHRGKWENEVEYGYNSPCTICRRRTNDNYEREGE